MQTKRFLEVALSYMKLALFVALWVSATSFVLALGATPVSADTLPVALTKTITILGWVGRVLLLIIASAPLVAIAVRIKNRKR